MSEPETVAELEETNDEDRGSLTIAMLGFALIIMMLAAFVIDGGMAITQRENAQDVAEQAARAAANDVSLDQLHQGIVQIAPDACQEAEQLVAQSHTSGALSIPPQDCNVAANGQSVTVTVQDDYQPILSGLYFAGGQVLHTKGTATAIAQAANG